MRTTRAQKGHSLLEAVIATAIFILVSVALSGVWIMYSKALGKSGEHLAANFLSRSVTESLVANGWDRLANQAGISPLPNRDFVVKRQVRGTNANITYNATWKVELNEDDGFGGRAINDILTEDIARIEVAVRWESSTGSAVIPGTDYNNEITYVSTVYKKGIR